MLIISMLQILISLVTPDRITALSSALLDLVWDTYCPLGRNSWPVLGQMNSFFLTSASQPNCVSVYSFYYLLIVLFFSFVSNVLTVEASANLTSTGLRQVKQLSTIFCSAGVGLGAVFQCIYLDSYYIVVMAWALFYFFNSFRTGKQTLI